jgi:hypothetical protein
MPEVDMLPVAWKLLASPPSGFDGPLLPQAIIPEMQTTAAS